MVAFRITKKAFEKIIKNLEKNPKIEHAGIIIAKIRKGSKNLHDFIIRDVFFLTNISNNPRENVVLEENWIEATEKYIQEIYPVDNNSYYYGKVGFFHSHPDGTIPTPADLKHYIDLESEFKGDTSLDILYMWLYRRRKNAWKVFLSYQWKWVKLILRAKGKGRLLSVY